jgi:REP-associated tyrosine transposase
MPRKTRVCLPGVPVHIVQRGNNREACFFSDDNYLFYKKLLAEGLKCYGGELHAYCFFTGKQARFYYPI